LVGRSFTGAWIETNKQTNRKKRTPMPILKKGHKYVHRKCKSVIIPSEDRVVSQSEFMLWKEAKFETVKSENVNHP
jgi:hypothetical protein